MFIIQRGLCGRMGACLSKGRFFGENMILTNAKRTAAVRTLNFVDVQVLSRSRLSYIFSNGGFDATKKMVRQKAIRLALTRMFVELCKFHRNKNKTKEGGDAGGADEAYTPDADRVYTPDAAGAL